MATRLQTGITPYTATQNFSRATASNVAAGSLVIVSSARWISGDSTAYVAGNLTKSAGTATIGTPVLEYTASPDANTRCGLWSVLVTGAGSLTLQVANPATTDGSIAVAEYSGSWDAARTEASNSGTGTSTAPSSGNATSAGAAVFIGLMHDNSGANESVTENGAWLLLGEDEDGLLRTPHSLIEKIVASGTTIAASWTIASSVTWVAGVLAFKEAAGGGGSPSPVIVGKQFRGLIYS